MAKEVDMTNVNNAIEVLSSIEDLELELCGSWLWIGGETKPHKEELKTAGAHWAPKKKKWYVCPVGTKRYHSKEQDMDSIRSTYGCEVL